MAEKIIDVAGIGDVSFYKRRGTTSVRLSINERGKIKVVMPIFMPYKLAEQFVRKHAEWLDQERISRAVELTDGLHIGRVHILRFIPDASVSKPVARVSATQIVVRHNGPTGDPLAQDAAMSGAIRSLRREAQHFLPKRLSDIAAAEGYNYTDVSIKQLRGRWGSCDHQKNITLNLFLMQLPLECIDYVIYHELAHTRKLHHGPDFWQELEEHLPNAKAMKKLMKQYQPTVPATRQ